MPGKKLSRRQAELLRRVTQERGAPSPRMQQLLEWDTDFFEAYMNFSGHPWRKGVLPPKVKELIYIAVDASVTHLYEPGVKLHMRKALEQGATPEEILEVLELVSVLGIHSCTIGVPALAEVCDAWQAEKK